MKTTFSLISTLSLIYNFLFLPVNLTGQDLILSLDTITAEPEEVIALELKVDNFENMIALQFGIRWDPTILEFIEISDPYILPDFRSFATNTTNEGFFRFSWFDNRIMGVDLVDDTAIFEVKFKLIGALGTSSEIKIGSELFTTLEATRLGSGPIPITVKQGRVNVGSLVTLLPTIPTFSQWGRLVFGLLVLNLGLILLMDRRRTV